MNKIPKNPSPVEKKMTIIVRNASLSFNYQILQKIECGIVLLPTEVKSLRFHGANIKEAFCTVEKNHLVIHNMHIPKYKYCFSGNHQEKRDRDLLIKKKQAQKIKGLVSGKSISILSEKLYFNHRNIAKITICICRIEKKIDKREKIKAREIKREIEQTARNPYISE